jgi:hypothetical protein
MLTTIDIVPRFQSPSAYAPFPRRKNLEKTEFDDAIGADVKPGAFNIKKEQRAFKF